MRVKIIINPGAGQPQPVLSILNDTLGKAGHDWDIAVTHQAGDGFAAAKQAVADGFELVCSCGGDGTLSEVAAALCGSDTPMGMLPGGTGNGLADDLCIPNELAAAAALIASQAYDLRSVDIGRVADTLFVLRVTMGFETSVVEEATRELKDKYGWLAYAFAGLKTLTNPPKAKYHVEVDGQGYDAEGVACIVANSASTGVMGLRLSDEVDVSDGRLDVIIAQTTDLATLAGSAADAAAGTEPRSFSRWTGTTVKVKATPDQSVLVDGEDGGRTPVEVSIDPWRTEDCRSAHRGRVMAAYPTEAQRVAPRRGTRPFVIGASIATVLLAAFAALAGARAAHSTLVFDAAVISAIHGMRTPWLNPAMTLGTNLGAFVVAGPVAAVLVGYLLIKRLWTAAALVMVVYGIGFYWGTLAQELIRRARPAQIDAIIPVPSAYSFPSGHSITAMLLYGAIAFLAVRIGQRLWTRSAVVTISVILIVFVGFTRVYLGAHWPTDVIGAWLLGGAWLAIIAGLYLAFEKRVTKG